MNSKFETDSFDKIEWKEWLWSWKQLWSETFWAAYNPKFCFKDFFVKIKEDFYDVLSENDKKLFLEVFTLIENNGFKLDIELLESLNIDQKKLLSGILYDKFKDRLNGAFSDIWKSLLIWIYRWKECCGWKYCGDLGILSEIAENFNGFDAKYFRQACNCLRSIWDKNIFHVLQEYNLIKNLDKDVQAPEIKETLDLWEDFSLWVFHANSDLWYWREVKYWMYELDSEWNEIKLYGRWNKEMVDEDGNKVQYASVLDRDNELAYHDASWELYNEYLDSPTWIALFYKWKPVACIWFYIKNWEELFINQIQKVVHYEYDRYWRCTWKNYPRIMDKIDRKTVLYNITTNLAKKYNVARIIIQWWENNRWIKEVWEDYETDYCRNHTSIYIDKSKTKPNKEKFHLDPEITHKIYDVFAEELWFKKDEEWNREKEI